MCILFIWFASIYSIFFFNFIILPPTTYLFVSILIFKNPQMLQSKSYFCFIYESFHSKPNAKLKILEDYSHHTRKIRMNILNGYSSQRKVYLFFILIFSFPQNLSYYLWSYYRLCTHTPSIFVFYSLTLS